MPSLRRHRSPSSDSSRRATSMTQSGAFGYHSSSLTHTSASQPLDSLLGESHEKGRAVTPPPPYAAEDPSNASTSQTSTGGSQASSSTRSPRENTSKHDFKKGRVVLQKTQSQVQNAIRPNSPVSVDQNIASRKEGRAKGVLTKRRLGDSNNRKLPVQRNRLQKDRLVSVKALSRH